MLYSAKLFLHKNSLLTLYYLYIHNYLNYAILSWGSTSKENPKKLISQQKHAVQIVNKRTRAFQDTKILNIYKLNILSVTIFMYQIRNKSAPLTFSGSFEAIAYGYQINISQFN